MQRIGGIKVPKEEQIRRVRVWALEDINKFSEGLDGMEKNKANICDDPLFDLVVSSIRSNITTMKSLIEKADKLGIET